MVNTLLESMRYDEASRARDIAYLIEDAEDYGIDQAMKYAEDTVLKETAEVGFDTLDPDIVEMMEHMDDLPDTADEEIDRILQGGTGITFEQMLGIDPIEEPEE